jgi:hypothetical protein
MRIIFVILLAALGLTASAQKISYDPPPNLPKHIGKTDYKFIVDSSIAIIGRRYTVEEVSGGSIKVTDSARHYAVINLDNLVLKCLDDDDRGDWIIVIRDHYKQLFGSMDAQSRLDPTNFETVKKFLSLRIYPAATVDQRGGADSLIARTDLAGTYTLLMLDLPGAFTPVRKAMYERWHKDQAAVFRIAQDNVDSQKVEKVIKTIDFRGSQVEVIMLGEENYAASYALDLINNSPELLGEWGCAIIMPNKGLVNLCKISREKPLDFVNFIQLTLPFNEKAYREHAQPISDRYFWYYKGVFTPIAVTTDAQGAVQVVAPVELGELMSKKP